MKMSETTFECGSYWITKAVCGDLSLAAIHRERIPIVQEEELLRKKTGKASPC